MHIIALRFASRKSDAPQWMAGHNAWLDQGFADGVFIASGSLHDGTGGCILTANLAREAIEARVAQDPFVVHGVVTPDVIGFKPGRLHPELGALLNQSPA